MTRKSLDCRRAPSERNCTLTIVGEEDEVLDAGTAHAIAAHGHGGDEGLREALRGLLVDVEGPSEPGAFVQFFEFRTDRIEEYGPLQEKLVETLGENRTTRWSILAADRDTPGTFVAMADFANHEAAMRNSDNPATGVFLEELIAISDAKPTFRNLDVLRVRPF